MHAALALRVLPLALGVVVASRAAEALPGIFAPKPEPTAVAPPPLLARRPAVSERLAGIIQDRMMAMAKAADASTQPSSPRVEGEAVMMEKFVVSSDKVRKIEPPKKESPAMRFLKTGRWFESLDGSTTGDFKLGPASSLGALPKEDKIRVEISITRKF